MKRIATILVLLIVWNAHSKDWCVRSAATGDGSGSDWDNAFTNLPASMVRGDTYYVATGTYGLKTLSDAYSGTDWIYIRHATVGDHAITTGWLDAYAGQSVFSEIKIDTGYYDIDGVTGSSNSARGIKVLHESGGGFGGIWTDNFQYYLKHHIAIKNVEITQNGNFEMDGIYTWMSDTNGSLVDPNLLVENCYIHHQGGLHYHGIYGSYQIWRNNFMEFSSQTDSAGHKEMMKWDSTNSFVRIYGNIFKDWQGYAVTGGIILGGGGVSGFMADWMIYNNVFYWTPVANPGGINIWGGGSRVVDGLDSSTTDHTNVYVFNNTFYNLTNAASANVFTFGVWGPANGATNNLWVNCNGLSSIGTNRGNYNAFFGVPNFSARASKDVDLLSQPFVSTSTPDFRLTAGSLAIGNGLELNTYFTTDKNGVTRGSSWDIGAYESTSSPIEVRLAGPTSLKANVKFK